MQKLFRIIVFFTLFFSANSYATSPISNVGGSNVNKKELDIDIRYGQETNNRKEAHKTTQLFRQHIDYGFSDFYAFRIVAFQEKRFNNDFEYQRTRFENRFQIVEEKDSGYNAGLRFAYNLADGDKGADDISFRTLVDIPFSNSWSFRNSFIFTHEIGNEANSGIILDVRNSVAKRINLEYNYFTKITSGLTLFSEFGNLRYLNGYQNQQHQIRTINRIGFKNGYHIDIGYGIGLTSMSSKRSFSFYLGKTF